MSRIKVSVRVVSTWKEVNVRNEDIVGNSEEDFWKARNILILDLSDGLMVIG